MPRRLWPLLVTAPSTLGPGVGAPVVSPRPLAAVLPAMIVFSKVTLAGPTRMPPPAPSAAGRAGLETPGVLTPVLPACALLRLSRPCFILTVAPLFAIAPPYARPPAPCAPQLRPPLFCPPFPPSPPTPKLLAKVVE